MATGPGGRLWKAAFWRATGDALCGRVRAGRRNPLASFSCNGRHFLSRELARHGTTGFVGPGPGPRVGYAVYGFAHGDAAAVDVIGARGRVWRAQLSPAWTSLRRGLRARAYLAVLSGKPPLNGAGIETRTTLADGRVLDRKP